MSGLPGLGELLDAKKAAEALGRIGFGAEPAADKASLIALAAGKLLGRGIGRSAEACAYFVPGRVEVLGKHTDYAGGRSVVAAVEKGFCVVAVSRDDSKVNMVDAAEGRWLSFEIDPGLVPTLGHWSNYPTTVARRLAGNFAAPLRGAEVAFASDLPPASGLSSSSAMVVAFYLVLASANDLSIREAYRRNVSGTESLAGYLGTIENGQSFGSLTGDKGVGTFGGSEDHTAILCCRPNTLSQYSYCPVRFERTIDVPKGYVFAVGSSGLAAEKTGSAREKYNRTSNLASAAAEAWRKATGRKDPHLAAAVASSPDAVAKMRKVLREARDGSFSSAQLLDRFEQFYAESEEIVPAAGDALARGDLAEFGRQVDRSQELTEKLLGNQVDQTVFLACSAREIGASAASAFGAGFGGSVWALVEAQAARDFLRQWQGRYENAFPEQAAGSAFFITNAGPAASELL